MGIDLFDSFSTWLDNKKSTKKAQLDKAKISAYFNWEKPTGLSGSTVSSTEPDKFDSLFDREDIQNEYSQLLVNDPSAENPRSDAIGLKLQNGILAAYEQAYRLRHATTPRLLAVALMDDKRWSEDGIPCILKKRIEFLRTLQKEDKDSNHK